MKRFNFFFNLLLFIITILIFKSNGEIENDELVQPILNDNYHDYDDYHGYNYYEDIAEYEKRIQIINETLIYNNRIKNFNNNGGSSSSSSSTSNKKIEFYDISPFQEGVYKVRPAFVNSTLGGYNGGQAFISNVIGSWEFGGYNSWVFYKDRGILHVLNNGDIIINGPIVPTRDPNSCHTWFINMMFQPYTPAAGKMIIRPYRELSPHSYRDRGGPIDPNQWKLYQPVLSFHSWIGIGCTHLGNIDFSNSLSNSKQLPLLQFGIGANGKNDNNGISFRIPISFGNNKINFIDMNVDVVLSY